MSFEWYRMFSAAANLCAAISKPHQESSGGKRRGTQFITAVNSFHPALKYTWEISDTCLAFLDIKLSIEGNGLCTSVHYKPTDSLSYLLQGSKLRLTSR